MKKLICACFVFAVLTFAAGAANVGTIDNGYPGDTEAQAQMLCELGLFRGTDKGFELEKPMTRAEAAAMLVRFLGAEEIALAGNWVHPFTDVPAWADQYVGWLYESGLTKGTSATTYGAAQSISYGQYATFLARAATDEDSYDFLVPSDKNEEAECNEAGFVRGDAVSLSARLLEQRYWKYEDTNGFTVAQKLIDRGVFSTEQFREAAWDVLPRRYERVGSTPYGSDETLSCIIAGVPVVRCPNDRIYAMYNSSYAQLYGETREDGQDYCLYVLDPLTLEPEELLRAPFGSCVNLLGYVPDGTDYLLFRGSDGKDRIYAVRGAELTSVMALNREQAEIAAFCCVQGERGFVFQIDDQTFYRADADGVEQLLLPEGDKLWSVLPGGLLLMENITPERTVISGWTWDGKQAGSFTVDNPYPVPEGMDADTLAVWCDQYSPQMLQSDENFAWGTAGLYCVEDGRLNQITDRPVYDYVYDPSDGSYVIVTHAPDRYINYAEQAVVFRTGDTLMRILPDGTAKPLLPDLPEGSLLLDQVELLTDGRVQFTTLKPTEPRMMGRFTCVLDDNKVTVTDATDDIFFMFGEDAIQTEQVRLDALGL